MLVEDQLTEKHRINKAITTGTIRLIGVDGESHGVVSLKYALDIAASEGLDLVEIAPQAVPPVCKITDYGKMKYELQKKKSEAKKKQKIVEIKEVKVTPSIGEHDYQVKLNSIKRFISDGDKVKVTLRFRGREIAKQEFGMALLDKLRMDVQLYARVESEPKLEGRQLAMILIQSNPK